MTSHVPPQLLCYCLQGLFFLQNPLGDPQALAVHLGPILGEHFALALLSVTGRSRRHVLEMVLEMFLAGAHLELWKRIKDCLSAHLLDPLRGLCVLTLCDLSARSYKTLVQYLTKGFLEAPGMNTIHVACMGNAPLFRLLPRYDDCIVRCECCQYLCEW